MAEIKILESGPERLWREFLELREIAFATKAMDDAMAAGRKWAAFLNEFAPPEHKSKLGGK